MKSMLLVFVFLLLAGCSDVFRSTATAPRAATPNVDAEGFVPLGRKNLDAFQNNEKGKSLIVVFHPEGDRFEISGDDRGYVFTKRTYKNFTLRLDCRWPNATDLPEDERPNANTGILVFITGEHKVWPKCLEVQGKWSELGHIKSNTRGVTVTVRDEEPARQKARKPVGEWNSIEIVANDGAITSYVNGVKIAESEPTELREGPIGFQAERFDVEFRNVRIREE